MPTIRCWQKATVWDTHVSQCHPHENHSTLDLVEGAEAAVLQQRAGQRAVVTITSVLSPGLGRSRVLKSVE